MSDSSSGHNLVEQIAGEFLERRRRGEKATIAEYCAKYPDQAEEIRSVLGTIELVENLNPASEDAGGANLGPQPVLEEIGDYRIIAEIGRGGMGVVYDALQKSLGRRVALKVLPRHAHLSESARNRFIREARAAASMHHTNIVPVFEVGEEGDCFFYAMQLIQGQGLDCVINELKELKTADSGTKGNQTAAGGSDSANTPSPPSGFSLARAATLLDTSDGSRGGSRLDHFYRSVAQISLQVAQALAYAHARGVIHRDIKPSNLLLDTNGIVWVTDFGLAKTDEEGLTQTGDFLGTLRYMSPERFSGKCDARADVYALGLTIYELLVQRAAFESSDRLELINLINKTDPPIPRSLDRQIPRDLETIVLKAIEKDPESRYASAKEMASDLHRFTHDVPIRARRASIVERLFRWSRRNKALAASLSGVATLLVILAVGATIAWFREAGLRDLAERRGDEINNSLLRESELRQLAEQRGQEIGRSRDEIKRNLYFAEMNVAGVASVERDGLGRVAELTERWLPAKAGVDYRGWEWYYLQSRVDRDTFTFSEVDGPVWDAAWSPDGTMIVSTFHDGFHVWDMAGKQRSKTLRAHTGMTFAIAWSPDGSRLASAGMDSTVKIWNVSTWQEAISLEGCQEGFEWWHVAWSPSGSMLAASSWNHTTSTGKVMTWDATTGGKLCILPGSGSISWTTDETQLALARPSGAIELWDARTGEMIAKIGQHAPVVTCIRWSPDGTRLASCSDDGTVRIWDGQRTWAEDETPQPIQILSGHTNNVIQANWSPNGRWLASASRDGTVNVWDADTGEAVRTLGGHSSDVLTVDWSPDGQ